MGNKLNTELFTDAEKNLAFFHHKMKRDLFDIVSYQELLSSMNKQSDFYRLAMQDTKNSPKIDLTIPRKDAWLKRLELLLANIDFKNESKNNIHYVYQNLSKDPALTGSQQLIFNQLAGEQFLFATITGQAGSGKSYLTAN
ncbi:Mrp family protein [Weissella oryzae SG25]|uniref:Mrp family protein n=1 Tax=Weissella oryzae (strain DSM 25784 / JCM 18191 / LMG 30913 / SG25) TaxID=1329250 RepID=A0A069CUE5_WEIOS|nr:hypothetical protein [Weissella oryzae]GAK30823.1 Mrp family protein [Weissella oryzae SG25]